MTACPAIMPLTPPKNPCQPSASCTMAMVWSILTDGSACALLVPPLLLALALLLALRCWDNTCALVSNVSKGKATPTPMAPAILPARTLAAAGPTINVLTDDEVDIVTCTTSDFVLHATACRSMCRWRRTKGRHAVLVCGHSHGQDQGQYQSQSAMARE
jgi:hypothetical protein